MLTNSTVVLSGVRVSSGAVKSRLSRPAIWVPPCGVGSGSASKERVPVHLERARLFFSGGAPEGVDGVADLDVDESGVLKHLAPARTGQPARDSAGPQVDVAQRLGRHRPSVGDVGELQPAAGLEHSADLLEHRSL